MGPCDEAAGASLNGIWLPLITPFTDGELDAAAVAGLVRHYAASGIDGLIIAATTGEGLTLDPEETERLAAVAAQAAAGRLPVYLGLCGSDTSRMAKRLAETQSWPVDGYLITCPYYTRPSQEGLRRHFTELASRTGRPIVVYNIPYRTGVNLTNDTLLQLAELGNVVGVKDCCANHAQSFDLLRRRPPGFSVTTGEDALFLNAIAHGADGGILASAHVDPQAFVEMRRAYLAGDPDLALQRWAILAEIVGLLFAEPNPAPVKHWLWLEGLIPSPELRLPMTGVSEQLAEKLSLAVETRRRVRT
jgi:4-hydroxy-tetrahydrodipicolinate synthase